MCARVCVCVRAQFGEGPAERRDRLKRILAKLEVEQGISAKEVRPRRVAGVLAGREAWGAWVRAVAAAVPREVAASLVLHAHRCTRDAAAQCAATASAPDTRARWLSLPPAGASTLPSSTAP